MDAAKKVARLYVIDAFTHTAFGGNSGAVVLLEPQHLPMTDAARQAIAMEMNLSETAFVEATPTEDDGEIGEGELFKRCSRFVLRWFTPKKEVALCGHGTIAAAAALWMGEDNSNGGLFFDTVHSGELSVSRGSADDERPVMHMNLPLRAPADTVPAGITADSELVAAAGVKAADVEEIVFNSQLQYLIIVLRNGMNRRQFEAIQPDPGRMLAASTDGSIFAVALTTMADDEGFLANENVWSRFFAPWAGIPEDPVTGSLHACLGPYWDEKMLRPHGAVQTDTGDAYSGGVEAPLLLRCRQCSPRGGELLVMTEWQGGFVRISGGAVMTVKGQLVLP